MPHARILAALALVLVIAQPAAADEIVDQINQAIEMYQAGDYAGAAGELEFAAAQIRQLRAGEISAALPDPLPGWTAEDAVPPTNPTIAGDAAMANPPKPTVSVMAESPMSGLASSNE